MPFTFHLIKPIIKKKLMEQAYGQGMGRHTEGEVIEMGVKDLRAISAFLGNIPSLHFSNLFVNITLLKARHLSWWAINQRKSIAPCLECWANFCGTHLDPHSNNSCKVIYNFSVLFQQFIKMYQFLQVNSTIWKCTANWWRKHFGLIGIVALILKISNILL